MKDYRRSPATFSLEYQREAPSRLSGEVEEAIVRELQREKALVDNPIKYPSMGSNFGSLGSGVKSHHLGFSICWF